jgi:microcystin-dependent protein
MEPIFIGQILAVGFNFEPRGWAFCDGRLLQISQNPTLYSLLSTYYGGDGVTTFALPDLRGRTPLAMGTGIGLHPKFIGERGGWESVPLAVDQMPAHTHEVGVNNTHGTAPLPDGKFLAGTFKPGRGTEAIESNSYSDTQDSSLHQGTISNVGSGQPHSNMQPYLGVNYIIALDGPYPPRN